MKRVHTEASWHSFYAASTPFRHSRSLLPLALPLTFSSSERRAASRYAVSVGRTDFSLDPIWRGVTDRHTFRDGVARPSAPSRVLVQRAPSRGRERNDSRSARASQRGEIRYGISPFPLHKLSNYCKQWYRTRHESKKMFALLNHAFQ